MKARESQEECRAENTEHLTLVLRNAFLSKRRMGEGGGGWRGTVSLLKSLFMVVLISKFLASP